MTGDPTGITAEIALSSTRGKITGVSTPEHDALIHRVLGDNYLPLKVVRLSIDEKVDDGGTVKLIVAERRESDRVEHASEYNSLRRGRARSGAHGPSRHTRVRAACCQAPSRSPA